MMNGTKWVAPGKGDTWAALEKAVECSPDNLECCQRVMDLITDATVNCRLRRGRSNLVLTDKPLTEMDLKRIAVAG